VWRTALRPRWLALFVVVLALASGMAALGDWQLRRAGEQGRAAVQARDAQPVVPLSTVLAPRTTFPAEAGGRRVSVTGRWDRAGQLLVTDRLHAGDPGFWVLTALRMADGSGVAVVRGWTPRADDPVLAVTTLPDGDITLTGVLLPDEAGKERRPGEAAALPADRSDRVDPVVLANRFDYPLVTGYLVADAPSSGLVAVDVLTGGGLAWQNLSYAIQWWLFALFGLFLWFRLVRDDHRGLLPGSTVPATPSGDPS